jgi:hypothetical protein
MKPEIDQILGVTAGQIAMEIAPLLPASYSQSTAGLISLLLGFCAQEYESGAEIRVAENTDMRALFGKFSASVQDAALKAKLSDAARSKDGSLKISDLNTANSALKTLLIALQADCEARGDTKAQAAIWAVLRASADRRFVKLPGM